MPIYEYRCTACGHELEALQRLSDAPLTVCPSCQKSELKKLLSAAGFQLKGSGWYVTDFRNNGAKPASKEKTAGGTAATTDGAATDSSSAADTKTTDTKTSDTKTADTKGAGERTADKQAATTASAKPATPAASTTKSDS